MFADGQPADSSAVVHPQRVTAGGRFLSHAVHHAANAQHAAGRRRRRSPELGVELGPSIHVRLPLPGAEPPLLLRLEPNGRLLAPGFVLERRIGYGLSPRYGVRNLTRISNPGCFYTGSLRGGNGSLALSTCNGLVCPFAISRSPLANAPDGDCLCLVYAGMTSPLSCARRAPARSSSREAHVCFVGKSKPAGDGP
ncbi:hypothetical protein HPB50_015069 [Hyalomma asiaticum]|uniref:Uncharacterized protein n=1 Tax=Hyalomma asiaticum TaxID=266040 RepID=A0ACB7SWE3_HYAAI|nr:hypothetical protein HPB50_015069 [Hyalomma asiaticum]